MTFEMPKVSVVMPVYNGENYLREAVLSIINQTFGDFELIVVNDGSTDSTGAILDELRSNEKIKVFTNSSNLGLIVTRNKGIQNSRGTYIAMLDSDDIAMPERLEKQVRFLEENPAFALIGSNIDLISGNGDYLYAQHYNAEPDFIPCILLFQNYFAQSTIMIRRSALPEEVYRAQIPLAEDYDLWVRIASHYKVGNIKEPLVKYRVHGTNISSTKASALRKSYKRVILQQLENLGLSPSDEELDLHTRIGSLEIPKDKKFVLESEKWLLKLMSSNRDSKTYPDKPLGIVAAKKWYEVCKLSGLGLWSCVKFFQSPLFQNKYLIYLLKAKMTRKLF